MENRIYKLFLYLMALLYLSAGINHFIKPEFYERIMPSYIPFHLACIYFSGVCEVVFALLLIFVKTRKLSAWLIVAMLLVFFVIHIQMLIDNLDNDGVMFWVAIIRIPVQFVLIWWAHLYTKNPQPKS